MSLYKKLSQVLLISIFVVLAGYSSAAPQTTATFATQNNYSDSQIEAWLQQLDDAMDTLRGMQNQLDTEPLSVFSNFNDNNIKQKGPTNNPVFYTQSEIDQMLSDLKAGLNSLISNQYLSIMQMIAGSNQIDQLSNITINNAVVNGVSGITDADIPDNITASNYMPLNGGGITVPFINATSTIATSTLQNTSVNNLSIGLLNGVLRANNGYVQGDSTTTNLPEGTNLYYTNERDIKFSTTSTDYWETLQPARGGGGFSTTSSDYWLSTNYSPSNWDSAYNWGDHSLVGYLLSESDPLFSVSDAFGITSLDISNWNSAYNWGDHSTFGYITMESDPDFNFWDRSTGISISESQISDLQSYLTSETDPLFMSASTSLPYISSTSTLGLSTDDIAEGTNNLYFTDDRFDARLSATTSLPNLATLLGLTNASTTALTVSGASWLNGTTTIMNLITTGSATSSITKLSVDNLRIASLLNCDTIDTDSNGFLMCGTDAGEGEGYLHLTV